MTEDIFGTGGSPDEVEKGLDKVSEILFLDGSPNQSPFSDKCSDFIFGVHERLLEGNACLVKSQVKRFVGCLSAGYRGNDECFTVVPESGKRAGEELDTCTWKGSMNRAWEIAKLLRCD